MIEKLINKLNVSSSDFEPLIYEFIKDVFFEGNSTQFELKQKEIEKFFSEKKIKAQEKALNEQVKETFKLATVEGKCGIMCVRDGACFFISNEELKILLEKNFDIYKFINELFFAFEEVKNITDFITSFETNKEELERLYLKLPQEQLLSLINFYGENKEKFVALLKQTFKITKLDKLILDKIFTTSKQSISDEFQVDKKTFNKWLKKIFGVRFEGRKKINLLEYIEIYNALIDEPKEYLDTVDFSRYLKRINKGMSFSKTFIAYETNFGTENDKSTLLKIQKEGLKDFPFYNSMNKFPYNLFRKIVNKLGEKLDF